MKAFSFLAFLCFSLSTLADSTVPVPDPIKETPGAITVRGVAGAGQERQHVWFKPLTKDKNGTLGRASAHEAVAHNLNETVDLPAGSYEILYSHTTLFVELGAGENKIIDLRKITVPKIDGTYQVELFRDLTNADEFKKQLLALWTQGYNHGVWDGTDEGSSSTTIPTYPMPPVLPHDKIMAICHTKNGRWKSAGAGGCAAWMGSTYMNLAHGAVKTDKDANLWMVEFQYYAEDRDKDGVVTSVQPINEITEYHNFGRQTLGYGADGDFFSVLPGVYGLEFKSLTGKVSTQSGVVIN
jgi:hypothetical protein